VQEIHLQTERRTQLVDITQRVQDALGSVNGAAAALVAAGSLGNRIGAVVSRGGRPDLAIYSHPVTEAGRVELLPFLHEQAVSITAHRFGTPNHLSDNLI